MIRISKLTKSFGDLQVLRGIDLEIQDGETLAIIGPSGSGKTTLLRCLNLLEVPESGSVDIGDHHYEGGHIHKKTFLEFRRATAMVFQGYNLFQNKTVRQNITLPLTAVKKMSKEDANIEADRLLQKVGLLNKADSRPSDLSGGQQQRIGIARALALKPEVILFDEPTSALDPELVQEVLDVIRNVVQDNITAVIVTHEMRFARDVADKVAFVDGGLIAEYGDARDVINKPQQERTRKFLQHYLNNTQ